MERLKILTLLPLVLLLVQNSYCTSEPESEDIRIRNNTGFVFSLPKTLLSGKNETVCLSTHYATESPARVIADLKIKERHFFTTRTLDSEHTCFELYVPQVEGIGEPQFASIRVQVQLNGIVYSAHNQDPLLVYPNKKVTFVETDRGTYKSGDRIRIRVLTLGQDLLPQNRYKVPQVRIRNPLDISVVVWENVTTELGLAQLEHQLSKDSVEGKWHVEAEGEVKAFEVGRYVLPRFKVEIYNPKIIYIEAPFVRFKVCARYTYGEIVKGSAFIRLTHSHYNGPVKQSLKKMSEGCANFSFTAEELRLPLLKDKFLMLDRFLDAKMHFQITATVTEDRTDNTELATTKTFITFKSYSMKFTSDALFLPGLPYHGSLQLGNINADLRGEVIEICYNIAIRRSWNYLNNEQCRNFTVSADDKKLEFTILPLRHNIVHIQLNARSLNHTNVVDSLLVVRLYSPSSSYVVLDQNNSAESSMCKTQQQFTVQYTTDKLREQDNVTFYYMLKTKGEIFKLRKMVHSVRKHTYPESDYKNVIGAKHKFVKGSASSDKFVVKFKLDDRVISKYQILVYYVSEHGETVTATKDVQIEPCLNNRVKARWSHKQLNPGGLASMQIETSSESICSISSVDKAAKFLDGTHQALNTNSFLKPFLQEREAAQSGRKSCVTPVKKKETASASPLMEAEAMWDLRRKKRFVYSFSEDFDAFDIFNKFGTATITNFKVVTKLCYTGPAFHDTNAPTRPVEFLTDEYDTQNEEKIPSIRSFFPETWLWELVPVSNTAVIHRTLPHTITSWVTNVLCVSGTQGVGISETTEISGFQPFFVDVLMPYSIKKGETLYLHVMVFNYLDYSLPVRVTLGDSTGLKLVDLMNRRSVSFCVANNATITHVFELKGVEMGRMNVTILAEVDSTYPGQCGPDVVVNKRDVVFKTLLVEPEGYPVTVTKSGLLCAAETQAQNVTWAITVPDNVIKGTSKAKIMLNGDLLGQTIENLDDLISLPTGCGEQIMASLAPNLFILRYLNATNTLTPSVKQKAVRNLKIGYQRILNYVHKDGSFSAFGYHDPSGSMFLTAFVVRSLHEAKQFIYVDQRVIDRAVAWILSHQLENGCFSTMLHVFQDMGGTSTENSTAGLTAYVMISLMEAGIDIPESIKTNAKYCIRGHYQLDKYTLAISSYALFKVNWYSEADRMLKKLLQLSNHKDNLMWWTNKDFDGSSANDIEITSYVLLSLLHQRTQDYLAKAHAVVRWLSSKQGPHGGFRSTQDTVVALDALTRYSLFMTSRHLDLRVNVEAVMQSHKLKFRQDDLMKSKKIVLKEPNNTVKIAVEGQGCVLAQTTLSYYLKQLPSSDAFKLDMEVAEVSNVDACSIASLTPCLAYTGPDAQVNMAILEVDLPSGYEADRISLYKLIDDDTKIKKFEEIENKIVLYFTKLNQKQVCLSFNINENAIVQSRVESVIKLYDYYKPEYSVVQFYKISEKCRLRNSTVMEISGVKLDNESHKNVVKRQINPDFVDVEIELATPEGIEGNIAVYVKPNSSIDLNLTENSLDDAANREKRQENFVNRDVDREVPDGLEGNKPTYVKLENITHNKL